MLDNESSVDYKFEASLLCIYQFVGGDRAQSVGSFTPLS